MYDVKHDYIFTTNQKDLNVRSIGPFWQKLCMLLEYNVGECPKVIFTSDNSIWSKYAGVEKHRDTSAFYDENKKAIVFWADHYYIDSKYFDGRDVISKQAYEFANEYNYNYIIPINYIYHEMIHHIQFILGDWLYDDLLEATAEIFTYFLTNQEFDDYVEEKVSFWYVGRKILKLKPWEFFIFIRDSIVDNMFYKEYFYDDPKVVRLLADEYSGSIEKLFYNMKTKLGKKKHYSIMKRDLRKIYKHIFYQ